MSNSAVPGRGQERYKASFEGCEDKRASFGPMYVKTSFYMARFGIANQGHSNYVSTRYLAIGAAELSWPPL